MRLIFDYLSNRKQRTKIGCRYTLWKELFFRFFQGPILGLAVEYLSFLSILLTSNTDLAQPVAQMILHRMSMEKI